MRSLPDTSTHDQQWESNPGPFDLYSNTLSTRPHAFMAIQFLCLQCFNVSMFYFCDSINSINSVQIVGRLSNCTGRLSI